MSHFAIKNMLGQSCFGGGAIGPVGPSSGDNLTLVIDSFFENGTWTSPEITGTARIYGWGGGAGGVTNTNGGGGGAFCELLDWSWTPNTEYTVTVGPGGTGEGGDSSLSLSGDTIFLAEGGKQTGQGGAAANCIGTNAYSGGNSSESFGTLVAGGGAGEKEAANNRIPGNPSGGYGGASGNGGQLIGGGGGAYNAGALGGARGELRVEYFTPAEEGYPKLIGYEVNRFASSTSHTLTIPQANPGDLLLAVVATNSNSGNPTFNGWETLFSRVESSSSNAILGFWRIATGDDPGAYTTTQTRDISAIIYRFSNATSVSAETVSGVGTQTSANTPELDIGTSAKRIWISAVSSKTASVSNNIFLEHFTAYPTGFGNIVTVGVHHDSATFLASCMKFEEAASVDPSAWTKRSTQWVGATIAISP